MGLGHLSALQASVLIPRVSFAPNNTASVPPPSPDSQIGVGEEDGTGNTSRLLVGRPSAPARMIAQAPSQNPPATTRLISHSGSGRPSTNGGPSIGARLSAARPSLARSSR